MRVAPIAEGVDGRLNLHPPRLCQRSPASRLGPAFEAWRHRLSLQQQGGT